MKGNHEFTTVNSAESGNPALLLFAVTLGKSLHLSESVCSSGKRREKSTYIISEVFFFSSKVASFYSSNLIKYFYNPLSSIYNKPKKKSARTKKKKNYIRQK